MKKSLTFLLVFLVLCFCSSGFAIEVAGTLVLDVKPADLPDDGTAVTSWNNRISFD